ncbi:MAG TPA: hypothetical protein VD932_00915 [Aquabacterium sp.]|nr:hypothetical protein [Aquabacterium sp.]
MAELRPPEDPALAYARALDDLLAETEAELLPRLQQAARRLRLAAGEWPGAALAQTCAAMEDGLAQIEVRALGKPGWLSRTFGGGISRVEREFEAKFDKMVEQDAVLKARGAEFAQHQQSRAAAARKPMLDLEIETRALAEALGRATEWLETLSHLLSRTERVDEGLLRFTAAAPGRLKRLHLLRTAAEQVAEQARESQAAATALVELLNRELRRAITAWRTQIGALAENAGGAASLDAAAQSHKELRRLMHRVHASCSHLKHQEERLLEGLTALGGP